MPGRNLGLYRRIKNPPGIAIVRIFLLFKYLKTTFYFILDYS